MEWWFHAPMALCCLWVFILGLGVGSFLNVLIARLPYEKSIIWPSSRCFGCFQKIGLLDNLPIIGYLRLRGRCRKCQAPFSAKYLWVELGTGLAFVALFFVEIVLQSTGGPAELKPWHNTPGLQFPYIGGSPLPPLRDWVYFAFHAVLLSALIASSMIDLKHRQIPPQITYLATLVGLIGSTAFPWPWPNELSSLGVLPNDGRSWILSEVEGRIPVGLTVWPFWGPIPEWAPAGSWKLGLLNGLIGAAVGMAIGRGIKMIFELGMGKEALGLGDADLLMMAGSFLGWQAISLALPVGAMLTLCVVLPRMAYLLVRGRKVESQLPFGPGIAAGVVTCWFGWPWLGRLVQGVFFDLYILGFVVLLMGGGMLIAGLFLRRGKAS
jgi:leader peptidase (prepilin peptidase) / N-methyltransferase